MTEEEKKEWNEYRKAILIDKSKSDDDYEKLITYLSAGALGLTLTNIYNIVNLENSKAIYLILIGWIFLALTLFLNLLSHFLSSRYNEKTLENIDCNVEYEVLINKINKRNRIISFLNISSIILFAFGILLIITFTYINLFKN